MSPARMNTPAAAPMAAARARLLTFCIISALASAISSRTSSDAFSETSWIALPSSDVCWSVIASIHQPLEDAGDDEGAAEREPDAHLGTVQRALGRSVGALRRLLRG